MAHKRALTIQNLIDYKPKTMGFTGTWLDMLGDPEPFGSWIIYGGSGQGKTRFTLQLTKYLMSFNGIRIAYDSLEEGVSETYKRAIIDTGVHTERHGHFEFWDRYDYDKMITILKKKRSANVVIIDSLQYMNLSYDQYKELIETFPKKLFLWISHESGSKPDGSTAKKVLYNSNIKIRVINYYAQIVSRYSGKHIFDIWPEYHNQLTEDKYGTPQQ